MYWEIPAITQTCGTLPTDAETAAIPPRAAGHKPSPEPILTPAINDHCTLNTVSLRGRPSSLSQLYYQDIAGGIVQHGIGG